MKPYDIIELSKKDIQELNKIALSEFGFTPTGSGKQNIIYQILDAQSKQLNQKP